MIDNNLLFSLILAIINTVSFYLLKNNSDGQCTDKIKSLNY